MRLAGARVCPLGAPEPIMVVSHPMLCVEGTDGRLCNQHLPVVEVQGVPLGRYALTADFVIDADASGLADAHANADFSPSTSLPTDWVRTRDPFQGVDKKNFGFSLTLVAAAGDAPKETARPGDADLRKASAAKLSGRAAPPRQISLESKGLDRAIRR